MIISKHTILRLIALSMLTVLVAVAAGCGDDDDDNTTGPANGSYTDLTAAEAKAMIDSNPDLIIIDVSPLYDQGHLPGAVSYPVGTGALENAIPMLDKSETYLVYCHTDAASMSGAQMLVDAGFNNVYRLEGNYAAWVAAGYDVEGDEGYTDITAAAAKAMIDANPEIVVVDVSPLYDQGHIPGAVSFPIGDNTLTTVLPTLETGRTYLIYCHSDAASMAGAEAFVAAGINDVYRLEGNYDAWVNAGYPVETDLTYNDITAAEAKAMIDTRTDLVVVDVSPLYDEGHLPGAVSYPVDGTLTSALPMLDKTKTYLVYCHADAPSMQGAQTLVDAGFPRVYRLEGNYSAWTGAGYGIEQ